MPDKLPRIKSIVFLLHLNQTLSHLHVCIMSHFVLSENAARLYTHECNWHKQMSESRQNFPSSEFLNSMLTTKFCSCTFFDALHCTSFVYWEIFYICENVYTSLRWATNAAGSRRLERVKCTLVTICLNGMCTIIVYLHLSCRIWDI